MKLFVLFELASNFLKYEIKAKRQFMVIGYNSRIFTSELIKVV